MSSNGFTKFLDSISLYCNTDFQKTKAMPIEKPILINQRTVTDLSDDLTKPQNFSYLFKEEKAPPWTTEQDQVNKNLRATKLSTHLLNYPDYPNSFSFLSATIDSGILLSQKNDYGFN